MQTKNNKFKRYLVLFFLLALLCLTGGIHLIHNHKADLLKHHDCPSHRLEMVLNSVVVFIAFSLYVFFRRKPAVLHASILPESIDLPLFRNRSPPV